MPCLFQGQPSTQTKPPPIVTQSPTPQCPPSLQDLAPAPLYHPKQLPYKLGAVILLYFTCVTPGGDTNSFGTPESLKHKNEYQVCLQPVGG